MKKYFIPIAFICMAVLVVPFPVVAENGASPLTLKDAVLAALKTHPSVKAEKQMYQAQEKAVDAARSGLFPSLDVSGDAGYENSHNTLTRTRQATGLDSDDERGLWYNTQTISISQLIWDGSRTYGRYEAEKHRLAASRSFANGTAEQVSLDTIESYIEVLKTRKIIRFAQDNIARLQDLKKKTKMRLNQGKGTKTDVDRVMLTLSDANVLLVGYQGALQSAVDRFRLNTGASADLITRGSVKIIPLYHTPEEAIDAAFKKNPALLVQRSNILQRESDLKVAKAAFHPTIQLVGEATREENVEALKDVDHNVKGLVRVNYNLFNGGGDLASVRENAALLSEAKYREAETLLKIESSVRAEFNNQKTAERQIPLLETKIDQSLQILEGYSEQFLVGKKDIMDVIEAQKMLFSFQAALENTVAQKSIAYYKLLGFTGQLMDILEIDFHPDM